jgi:hypothetical protein
MKMRCMKNMKINTNFGIPLKCPNILLNATGNMCFAIGNTGVIPVPYKI